MHEQAKIDEAAHFLNKMRHSVNNPTAYNHEFSAFTSAARSVLQYTLDEAKSKRGGQKWFDTQVASHLLI